MSRCAEPDSCIKVEKLQAVRRQFNLKFTPEVLSFQNTAAGSQSRLTERQLDENEPGWIYT